MFANLVDHLWQSAWICGAITLLAFISRDDFAPLRLWLWRIAALKFVFPFALLVAVGGRLGFHVRFPDDPAPAGMLGAFRTLASLASPARVHEWSGWRLLLAMLAVFAITGACAWWLRGRLHVEQQHVLEENLRRERDINDLVRRPGFFNSALLTACALLFVAIPVLAGGLEDRQRRYELLVSNAKSLRDATVTMKPAAPGMGRRFRIDADERGISIRNVTIQELAGLAYGVTRYYVRGDHWQVAGEEDWFIVPRYDVRVTGRVLEPARFDAYSLRARITRMLAERHGLEIYVDSKCQPPCGKYGVPMPENPL
jgi:hypothetical protein